MQDVRVLLLDFIHDQIRAQSRRLDDLHEGLADAQTGPETAVREARFNRLSNQVTAAERFVEQLMAESVLLVDRLTADGWRRTVTGGWAKKS